MEAKAAALARCVSDIEVADFVALDLEFSGLFLAPQPFLEAISCLFGMNPMAFSFKKQVLKSFYGSETPSKASEEETKREFLKCEDYFSKCVASVPKFLALQLGLCCGRLKDGAWELRALESKKPWFRLVLLENPFRYGS